jgi:hypothetical protein
MSKQLVIFGATGTQGSALLEALYQTKSSSKNTYMLFIVKELLPQYSATNTPVSSLFKAT